MAESDVFSVDVDEALKVTDLDLQNVNLLSDQDDMGFTLPPDDSTWPYYSNQENGQVYLVPPQIDSLLLRPDNISLSSLMQVQQ